MRTPSPGAVVNLSERAYSMDIRGAMMVVATADKKVRKISLETKPLLVRSSEDFLTVCPFCIDYVIRDFVVALIVTWLRLQQVTSSRVTLPTRDLSTQAV